MGAVVVSVMLHLQNAAAAGETPVAGPWLVAAYLLCSALPLVLLAPWAGRLADTMDSRTLATASSAVSAAAVAGMGLGMQYLENYLPVLFAMTFLLDAAQSVASPTWQALLPRIVGEDRTPRAMGTMQATIMIAGMAGPAAGGLLSGWGGTGLVFAVASGCYVAMGLGALLIRTRRGTAAERAGQAKPALLDGLRLIRRDSLVWALVLGAMFFIVVGEATNVLEVFLARNELGATEIAVRPPVRSLRPRHGGRGRDGRQDQDAAGPAARAAGRHDRSLGVPGPHRDGPERGTAFCGLHRDGSGLRRPERLFRGHRDPADSGKRARPGDGDCRRDDACRLHWRAGPGRAPGRPGAGPRQLRAHRRRRGPGGPRPHGVRPAAVRPGGLRRRHSAAAKAAAGAAADAALPAKAAAEPPLAGAAATVSGRQQEAVADEVPDFLEQAGAELRAVKPLVAAQQRLEGADDLPDGQVAVAR